LALPRRARSEFFNTLLAPQSAQVGIDACAVLDGSADELDLDAAALRLVRRLNADHLDVDLERRLAVGQQPDNDRDDRALAGVDGASR
jgi:hypothetical protein